MQDGGDPSHLFGAAFMDGSAQTGNDKHRVLKEVFGFERTRGSARDRAAGGEEVQAR